MQLMIVASNQFGRLSVKDGKLCPQSATQYECGGMLPTPALPKELIQQLIDESTTKLPEPTRILYGTRLLTTSPNRTESDIQLDEKTSLQEFNCTTKEDFIMWECVVNIVSLELIFHLNQREKMCNISGIMSEILCLDVSLSPRFNVNNFCILQ